MKVVLSPGAYMPVRAHNDDAGYDLATKKRRPCPAGTGCTVRKFPKKRKG